MAFNGTGTFERIYNWVTDKVNNIKITASRFDTEMDGMATGLSTCITKDGQTTITNNIPFNSKKITGLSAGSARTDSLNIGQVQDGQFTSLGLTTGAADEYAANPAPAVTAYTNTMSYTAQINEDNLTTTPYLQLSGIASPASNAVIVKYNDAAAEIPLEIGDLLGGKIYHFIRKIDNTGWIVENPEKSFIIAFATTTDEGLVYLPSTLTISNNLADLNSDIDISAGNFQFSDGSGQGKMTAMTKRLDVGFAVGTNQGMLLSGSKAPNSWYHLFALYNPTTNVSDVGAMLAVAGIAPDPTSVLPTDYTKWKRILSIRTDASGNIRQGNHFSFNGIYYFILKTPFQDYYLNNPGTSAVLATLTTPLGVKSFPLAAYWHLQGSPALGEGIFTSPDQDDIVPSISNFNTVINLGAAYAPFNGLINTNTSSQIRYRVNISNTDTDIRIYSYGWIEINP